MAAGARVIHFDVIDGRFVPPVTIGPLVAASTADQVHDAGGAIDVHLMIEAPERQIEAFAEAAAVSITFHEEATPHANRTLAAIRELGCLAGVAINPGTPVEAVSELVDGCADIVLNMTVNPGWGGQSFIAPPRRAKVSRLAALAGETRVEVDGGIDTATAGPDRGRRRLPLRRRLRRLRRRRPGCRLHGDRRCRGRRLAPRDQGADYLLPPCPLGGVVSGRSARRSDQRARAWRPPSATTPAVTIA